MKTNFIYAAALWILTAAMLTVSLSSATAQSGADTPQALGAKLFEAIKSKNKDQFKSLIHPDVIAYVKDKNPGEVDAVIDNYLTFPVPQNHEFTVISVNELPNYDKATQTLKTSEHTFYFPAPLSDLLVVTTEAEVPKIENGKETKTKAKVGVMELAIAQSKGNWYIIIPMVQSSGEQDGKQQ